MIWSGLPSLSVLPVCPSLNHPPPHQVFLTSLQCPLRALSNFLWCGVSHTDRCLLSLAYCGQFCFSPRWTFGYQRQGQWFRLETPPDWGGLCLRDMGGAFPQRVCKEGLHLSCCDSFHVAYNAGEGMGPAGRAIGSNPGSGTYWLCDLGKTHPFALVLLFSPCLSFSSLMYQ